VASVNEASVYSKEKRKEERREKGVREKWAKGKGEGEERNR
jgi:hypothetical protein